MEDLVVGLLVIFTTGVLAWWATEPLRRASQTIYVRNDEPGADNE